MKVPAHVAIQRAEQAKSTFDLALKTAKQTLNSDLAQLQTQVRAEEDLSSIPRAALAAMTSFELACRAAADAFKQRTEELAASIRPTENLDFFGGK